MIWWGERDGIGRESLGWGGGGAEQGRNFTDVT